MLEAAAFGCPYEAAILQEAQVVVQGHPGFRCFGKERALLAGAQVGFDQFELALVAGLTLEGEVLRITPVDPSEVDVRVLAKVDACRRRVGFPRPGDEQFDADIRITSSRITLFDHVGAIGIDLIALLHRHLRFVDARERDRRVVRCPPVAGVAVHFLVGDEFGDAVADDVAAVARELAFLAGGQVDHP